MPAQLFQLVTVKNPLPISKGGPFTVSTAGVWVCALNPCDHLMIMLSPPPPILQGLESRVQGGKVLLFAPGFGVWLWSPVEWTRHKGWKGCFPQPPVLLGVEEGSRGPELATSSCAHLRAQSTAAGSDALVAADFCLVHLRLRV